MWLKHSLWTETLGFTALQCFHLLISPVGCFDILKWHNNGSFFFPTHRFSQRSRFSYFYLPTQTPVKLLGMSTIQKSVCAQTNKQTNITDEHQHSQCCSGFSKNVHVYISAVNDVLFFFSFFYLLLRNHCPVWHLKKVFHLVCLSNLKTLFN